jgi:tape measure domain-containing protein
MIVRTLLTLLGFQSDQAALRKYDQALKAVVTTTKILATATIGMGVAFLKGAGDIEQTTIAFETMLGSAEKADKLIKDITDFAAKTPFELTGLIDSSKKLLAFGFAAEEIIPTMTALGDISAGVGREKLGSIILAFGKIRTKGKATMEELNILLEAGVPILDELAGNLGVAKEEIFKLVRDGAIGFNEVNDAVTSLTTGTGKFTNLMEKQSKSLIGILSNIKDFLTNLGNAIGKELLRDVKSFGRGFLDILKANEEIIKANLVGYLKNVIRFLVFVFVIVKKVVQAFAPFVKQIFSLTGEGFNFVQVMKDILNVLKPVVEAVFRLGKVFFDAIGIIAETFQEFKIGEMTLSGYESIFKIIGGSIGFVADTLKSMLPLIRPVIKLVAILFGLWTKVWAKLEPVINDFFKKIQPVIDSLGKLFGGLFETLADTLETLSPLIDAVLGGLIKSLSEALSFIADIANIAVGIGGFILDSGGPLGTFTEESLKKMMAEGRLTQDQLDKELRRRQAAEERGQRFGEALGNIFSTEPPPGLQPIGSGAGGQTINMDNNITVELPPGTTEEQAAVLQEQAEVIFRNKIQGFFREATTNNPGVD